MSQSRRGFLASVAATVGCGPEASTRPVAEPSPGFVLGAAVPSIPRKPNIVLVLLDQLRADTLGCVGHPIVLTPNIDTIASSAVSFRRNFTNGTLCRPARLSLMTGLYVHQHRVVLNESPVPDPEGMPSHVRRLRDEAGYHTHLVGKVHVHDVDTHLLDGFPILRQWGYDSALELLGPVGTWTIPSEYSDWLTATTPPSEPDKYERFRDYMKNYGQNIYETHMWDVPAPDAPPSSLGTADHLDSYCGEQAVRWIRENTDPRPFYLQIGFPGPHPPYDATTAWRELYDVGDPDLPAGILDPPSPLTALHQTVWDDARGPTTPDELHLAQVRYYAKLTMVDEWIGRIWQALRDAGRDRDSWIVVTSDHGDLLGDHQLVGKKAFFEGALRIPMLVRPPGGVVPWVTDAMTETVDLTASLLAMGGLPPEPASGGTSFVPRVTAGPTDPEAHRGKGEILSAVESWSMLRDEEYKLVKDTVAGRVEELYDLVADPEERLNLVSDPGARAVRDALEARLDTRLRS